MSDDKANAPDPSQTRDKEGGFAANPELAREAGRKGGEIVKERYGPAFYQEIGRKGGEVVKRSRGAEFYAEIGRKGGERRGSRNGNPEVGTVASSPDIEPVTTSRKRSRSIKPEAQN